MKKNSILSFLFLVSIVCYISCNTDSQTEKKDNPILGEFPYISYYFPVLEEELEKKCDEALEKAKSQSERGKIYDKYYKNQEELKKKKKKMLEELRQVRGNPVPFEQDPDQFFEVVSAEVAGVYEKEHTINLNFKVKSLTAGNINTHQRMYCLLLDSKGNIIKKQRITPFFEYISNAYGVHNRPYNKGEILVKNGSYMSLNCKFTDYTDFAKVRFVSEEIYENE